MVILMDKTLEFWLGVELGGRDRREDWKKRQKRILKILERWEEFGDAGRKTNRDGKVRWCASEQLLSRLQDAERDALEEFDDADW